MCHLFPPFYVFVSLLTELKRWKEHQEVEGLNVGWHENRTLFMIPYKHYIMFTQSTYD